MTNLWDPISAILSNLGVLLYMLLIVLLHWSLAIAWFVWWLFGVNWSRVWPVLGRGGWVVLALLVSVSALVWSKIEPDDFQLAGMASLPHFGGYLIGVIILTLLTLFCGYLQAVFHWEPVDVDFNPPDPVTHLHEVAHGGH